MTDTGQGGGGGTGGDWLVPGWLARAICVSCLRMPPYSLAKVAHAGLKIGFGRLPGLREVEVKARDGVALSGAYVPGARRADGARRLPVVFAHGVYQIRESNLWLVRHLVSQGHDVLALDMRAHGRSRGRATTFGVLERDDIARMIGGAQGVGMAGERVITMGLSLGAGCVLQHAPTDGRVAGVCAIAPFADLKTAVVTYREKYFFYVSQGRALASFDYAARRVGFDMGAASPLEAAAKIRVPVLYLVGQNDNNLGQARHTRPLYEATARGLGELALVPGATHFNIHTGRFEVFNRAVVAFCARVSGG